MSHHIGSQHQRLIKSVPQSLGVISMVAAAGSLVFVMFLQPKALFGRIEGVYLCINGLHG